MEWKLFNDELDIVLFDANVTIPNQDQPYFCQMMDQFMQEDL